MRMSCRSPGHAMLGALLLAFCCLGDEGATFRLCLKLGKDYWYLVESMDDARPHFARKVYMVERVSMSPQGDDRGKAAIRQIPVTHKGENEIGGVIDSRGRLYDHLGQLGPPGFFGEGKKALPLALLEGPHFLPWLPEKLPAENVEWTDPFTVAEVDVGGVAELGEVVLKGKVTRRFDDQLRRRKCVEIEFSYEGVNKPKPDLEVEITGRGTWILDVENGIDVFLHKETSIAYVRDGERRTHQSSVTRILSENPLGIPQEDRKTETAPPAEAAADKQKWKLVFEDDFGRRADEPGKKWRVLQGKVFMDGRLVNKALSIVECAAPIRATAVRVEFTCRQPHPAMGSVIVFLSSEPNQPRKTGYLCVLGTKGTDGVSLYTPKDGLVIQRSPTGVGDQRDLAARLLVDYPHRVICQRDGNTLTMFLDGRRVLEFVDKNPIGDGADRRVGFILSHETLIDDVRIYTGRAAPH